VGKKLDTDHCCKICARSLEYCFGRTGLSLICLRWHEHLQMLTWHINLFTWIMYGHFSRRKSSKVDG
jgi:hypothetical protein